MFDEIKFTEATRKLVDCSYSLGDTSKGYDCLSMLLRVYRDMGFQFPSGWRGWTEANYAERWSKGEGREEFIDFVKTLGRSVPVNFMQKGDLIIFDKGIIRGPGIYIGNGNMIRIYDGQISGGKVSPVRHYVDSIVDVRRLL